MLGTDASACLELTLQRAWNDAVDWDNHSICNPMKLYVEPMDAVVVEFTRDGRVRLEGEDWSTPTLQERRAIIFAAQQELAALTELIDVLQS